MPLKTLIGTNLSALLREAETSVGPDALILHVRRIRTADGIQFEVAAADPATAAKGPPPPAPNQAGADLELIVPRAPRTGPLIIALVGPTGVGKTTTLAKLATHPRVFGSRTVGLLGLDTYRIGAIEQLETYAGIARLPCEIVYTVDDLAPARERLAQCEVILVDTPGRSPTCRQDRESVHQLLEALTPTEVHLVVPAALPDHLLRGLLRPERGVSLTHLLVTKLDEAPDESVAFELAIDLGLPIRWTTAGQEVPFDLSSAEGQLAAARLSAAGAGSRRPARAGGGAAR